jgi:hypothetical protein
MALTETILGPYIPFCLKFGKFIYTEKILIFLLSTVLYCTQLYSIQNVPYFEYLLNYDIYSRFRYIRTFLNINEVRLIYLIKVRHSEKHGFVD